MKKLFFTFILASTTTAFAQVPVYYWDNQEGLVSANENCAIERSKKQQFGISQYFSTKGTSRDSENLRSFKGVELSNLLNGSIVKRINGKKKDRYINVEVVGVNDLESSARWRSKKGDEGYLYKFSVHPMENYFLEIKPENLPELKETKLAKADSTFWHLVKGDSYFRLDCPSMSSKRVYDLFKVYQRKSTKPTMLVAVSAQETDVFNNFKSLIVTKARKLLSINVVNENKEDLSKIKVNQNTTDEDNVNSGNEDTTISVVEETIQGGDGIDDLVCLDSSTVNVRNDDLNRAFKAKAGERLKVYQSFDGSIEKKKVLGGTEYTFTKVDFFEREEKDQREGWIAKRFIVSAVKCPYINKHVVDIHTNDDITGLNDSKCCNFPTVKKSTARLDVGTPSFGARRSGGKRKHAGVDIYRTHHGEDVLAVAPGEVIAHRYFYMQTDQITVRHPGGFIIRYGEIGASKKAPGTKIGDKVKMGQTVGYIGKLLRSNGSALNVPPMLHMELYEGTMTGALTNRTNGSKYQRRLDLLDPTSYLKTWQKSSFYED